MTVLNIRGTHGSGKSSIVKHILTQHTHQPLGSGKRPEGYKVSIPGLSKPLYVVGPYQTACGGADAIQPYDLIWPRVLRYARLGHVIFEGALVSSCVGAVGEALAKRKDAVACFLDTPLELCLERIQTRRALKGDHRPLDPKNTAAKHASSQRARGRLEELGLRCVTLNHKKANKQVLELLHAADKKAKGR